jgi:hypothetical protein
MHASCAENHARHEEEQIMATYIWELINDNNGLHGWHGISDYMVGMTSFLNVQ